MTARMTNKIDQSSGSLTFTSDVVYNALDVITAVVRGRSVPCMQFLAAQIVIEVFRNPLPLPADLSVQGFDCNSLLRKE